MSVSLTLPSEPSPALSALTKAPCLQHFPGHLIESHLTRPAAFTDTLKVRRLRVWSLTEEPTDLGCPLLTQFLRDSWSVDGTQLMTEQGHNF